MKIRADENVSIRLVQAIRALGVRPGWELSHVREYHGPSTTDETWLPHFAREGGIAMISADGRIFKKPHQLVAIRESGLVSIILADAWVQSKKYEQAANLIFWWPKIEAVLENAKPGDCWRIPFKFDKKLDLQYKKIDYDKAVRAVGQ